VQGANIASQWESITKSDHPKNQQKGFKGMKVQKRDASVNSA